MSKVESEDLNNAVSSNWLNGLSGKVAGLNFDSASAGPSGSIRVTLRGESSLNPSKSEALFVVDGIPINSNMLSTSGQSSSAYNSTSVNMPIDYGNGASDLNPDDIESVTVLKGAGTVVAFPGGGRYVLRAGNPGMAKGGSGDVLTGVTAAMLGQLPPEKAVLTAVWLHSAAADRCAGERGEYGMTPTDIIEKLPVILKEITE